METLTTHLTRFSIPVCRIHTNFTKIFFSNMASMEEVLDNLATAIGQMNSNKVPPPTPYQGYGDIAAFFRSFENYCLHIYGNSAEAYLSVLPSFLEGEARQIALSYGTGNGIQYETVKERIIAEMTGRRILGSNQVSNIFSTKRRENETLLCYSIRLESMAAKIPNATAEIRGVMVKSKFISSLDERVAKELNLRLGGNNNATLSDMVWLATLLEDSAPGYFPAANAGNSTCSSSTAWPVAAVDSPVSQLPGVSGVGSWGNANRVANQNGPVQNSNVKCYGCDQIGHIRQNCTAVCTYCGKSKHVEAKCYSKRNEQGSNRRQGNNRQGSDGQDRRSGSNRRDNRDDNTPSCSFCGTGPHSLVNCRKFKEQFMACNWCGATDHKSHLCPDKPGNGARSVL